MGSWRRTLLFKTRERSTFCSRLGSRTSCPLLPTINSSQPSSNSSSMKTTKHHNNSKTNEDLITTLVVNETTILTTIALSMFNIWLKLLISNKHFLILIAILYYNIIINLKWTGTLLKNRDNQFSITKKTARVRQPFPPLTVPKWAISLVPRGQSRLRISISSHKQHSHPHSSRKEALSSKLIILKFLEPQI